MKTTTAQVLYDARDQYAIISGLELHDLFRAVCGGEPSPAGRTPISVAALRQAATEMAASVPEYSQFVEDALTVWLDTE